MPSIPFIFAWRIGTNQADAWRSLLASKLAERFIIKWHKDGADAGRKRHASAVGGAQGNGKGGGNSRKETAVNKSRKQTADRVARFHAD